MIPVRISDIRAMKRALIFFSLLCLGCTELRAEPRGFSRFPLNVDGRIADYTFLDIDGDDRRDAMILVVDGGRYSLALFLQQSSGFSSDPNQVLPLGSDAIALWAGAASGGQAPEIFILSRSGLRGIPFQGGRFRTDKQRLILNEEFADPGFGPSPIFFPLLYREKNSGRGHFLVPLPGGIRVCGAERNSRHAEEYSLRQSDRVPLFAPLMMETKRGTCTLDGIRLQDVNGDGRPDLLSINTRGCTLYLQGEDGSFAENPTAAVPFQENETTRLLALADCTGDRIPDLIFVNEGKTNFLSNKKITLGFFYGSQAENGTIAFKGTSDRQLTFTGVYVSPIIADFNGDGVADLVIVTATYSLGNFFSSLISSKSKLQVEFFRSNRGEFSGAPDAVRETSLPGKIYEDPSFSPIVLFGDVTGDRRRDFILGEENGIFCYPASQNRLFETTPDGEIRSIPNAVTDVCAWKIDNDEKEDLCFIARKKNPGTLHVYLTR